MTISAWAMPGDAFFDFEEQFFLPSLALSATESDALCLHGALHRLPPGLSARDAQIMRKRKSHLVSSASAMQRIKRVRVGDE